MGFFSRLFGASRDDSSASGKPRINGNGSFAADLIGEGRHTADLAHILETAPGEGDERIVDAALVFADEDRYQANAVPVQVNGCLVGYLPRATAQACQAAFSAAAGSGNTLMCSARIRRVHGPGEPTRFQVQLDLPLGGEDTQ